ncbi:MAG: hypothetical protein AAF682_10875 [Planctomycetota bacterium]
MGTLLLLLWLVLAPAGPPDDDPVLANGGFEDGLEGWIAFDATGQGRIEAEREAKRGKRALVLERAGGQGLLMVRQNLPPAAVGEEVELRFDYRSPTGGRAQVSLFGYDGEADQPVLDRELLAVTGKVKRWKEAEARIRVPERVVSLALAIRVFEDGEYWFDGVELVVHGAEAAGPVRNGDFERGLLAWEAFTPSGRASAEVLSKARKSGKNGLRVEREARCPVPWDEVVTELALPKKPFTVEAQARASGATAVLEARWYDERRMLIETEEIGRAKKSWSRLRARLKPPKGTRFAELAFRVSGTGHADLDAVEVK